MRAPLFFEEGGDGAPPSAEEDVSPLLEALRKGGRPGPEGPVPRKALASYTSRHPLFAKGERRRTWRGPAPT